MPESRPPTTPAAPPPPPGARPLPPPSESRAVRFGGLLRGRFEDGEALRLEANALRTELPIPVDIEVERGRYTIRFDDRILTGAECGEFDGSRILEVLQRVVDAGEEPLEAESTLRFVQVFQSEVAEVALLLEGGEFRQLGRMRAIGPEDQEMLAELEQRARSAQRRVLQRTLMALVGAAVLAVILRIPDRILGPAPSEVQVDLGSFEGELQVELESRLGALVALVQRSEAPGETVQNVRIELRSDDKLLQFVVLRIDSEDHAAGEALEVPFAPDRSASRVRITKP